MRHEFHSIKFYHRYSPVYGGNPRSPAMGHKIHICTKSLQGMFRLFTISLQLTKTTYLVSHLDLGCDWSVVQITGQIVSFLICHLSANGIIQWAVPH